MPIGCDAVDNDPYEAAIRHATDQLASLTGITPRLFREAGAVRIEVDVTDQATHHWEGLLEVLAQGAAFGLTDTAGGGQVAWIRLEPGEAL
ncbi:hypothetical protein ACH4TS_00290 [Streptomyces albidoflavus]